MTSQELYDKCKDVLDAIGNPKDFFYNEHDDAFRTTYQLYPPQHAQAIIEKHLSDWLDENVKMDWAIYRTKRKTYDCGYDGIVQDYVDYDTRLDALLWAVNQIICPECGNTGQCKISCDTQHNGETDV